MGFSVIYTCTRDFQSDALQEIIDAASKLASRRTWMSCEPLLLRARNGVLTGSSKPRISRDPDEPAALSEEGLPDGTLSDVLHGLCELSVRFGISWEISHNYADGPLGYIQNGKLMNVKQQKVGAGHIFCLADSFDDILRQLSPEYFAAAHGRLTRCLKSFGIRIPLRLGWMHPGYACPLPDSEIPGMWEPTGVFGWVTASPMGDPDRYISQWPQILDSLTAEAPELQWASCSARLYRYLRIEAGDYVAAHQLFIDSALDDPSHWSASFVIPDHRLRDEPWRRLCFAVANQDQELERELWELAANTYSFSAVELLRQGMEHARRCVN